MKTIIITEQDGTVDVDHTSCGDILTALGLLRLTEEAIIRMASPQWIDNKEAEDKRKKAIRQEKTENEPPFTR